MTQDENIKKKRFFQSDEFQDLKKTSIRDFFNGDVFIKSYFRKQIGLLTLILCLIFLYMDNRIHCEKQYRKIDRLNKELVESKYIAMVRAANLLSISRIDKIQKQTKEHGLDLIELEVPPYKIKRK